MAQDRLFTNNQKVETLKKYLYSNRLAEDEINRRLTDFAEYFYAKGIDQGCVIQKNNRKRIDAAISKCRKDKFEKIFEGIDDEHDELILSRKKTK